VTIGAKDSPTFGRAATYEAVNPSIRADEGSRSSTDMFGGTPSKPRRFSWHERPKGGK